MQGVILAAGKGKRLHPVTLQRTKAMAPVAGKPIVARVLDLLVENGIHEFILLVSPDDPEIVPYFQQKQPALDIRFVVQPERLGMANALSLAAPYIRGSFVMSACDNLTPAAHIAELIATHKATAASATLSLMEIDIAQASSTGIIAWDDAQWIHHIVEKPKPEEAPSNTSSLPLYVFTPEILAYLPEVKLSPRGEYELQDAIQLLIERTQRVTGVLTPSRIQLTNTADLLALNQHFLTVDPAAPQILTQAIGTGTQFIPPVRIDAGVMIGENCVIGPHVYIEANCQIGDGVQLSDALVLRHSTLATEDRISNAVSMGEAKKI